MLLLGIYAPKSTVPLAIRSSLAVPPHQPVALVQLLLRRLALLTLEPLGGVDATRQNTASKSRVATGCLSLESSRGLLGTLPPCLRFACPSPVLYRERPNYPPDQRLTVSPSPCVICARTFQVGPLANTRAARNGQGRPPTCGESSGLTRILLWG